jgi:hypothetical protein
MGFASLAAVLEQKQLTDPDFRAALELTEAKRQHSESFWAKYSQRLASARLALSAEHLPVPHSVEDAFHLASMVGIPREAAERLTYREVFEQAMKWAEDERLEAEREQIRKEYRREAGHPPGTSKSGPPASVETRMMDTYRKNPTCVGWTARYWAEKLGCSKSAVTRTATWKAIIQDRGRNKRSRLKTLSRVDE